MSQLVLYMLCFVGAVQVFVSGCRFCVCYASRYVLFAMCGLGTYLFCLQLPVRCRIGAAMSIFRGALSRHQTWASRDFWNRHFMVRRCAAAQPPK